jgi:hypothetical protein
VARGEAAQQGGIAGDDLSPTAPSAVDEWSGLERADRELRQAARKAKVAKVAREVATGRAAAAGRMAGKSGARDKTSKAPRAAVGAKASAKVGRKSTKRRG